MTTMHFDLMSYVLGALSGMPVVAVVAYKYLKAEKEFLLANGRPVSRRQWRRKRKLGMV